jgi:glycerol-3-phosphate dehydrogenase
MREREAALREAAAREFDLIVIGGGINGAGVARDAALRGLSVLLIERHDFGFGTTWRSTKLIHGGLRYLEHREWGLVREGLHERSVLLRIAPHLVRPLEFLVPIYRGGRYGYRMVQAGLWLYDLLALGTSLPRHRALGPEAVAALEPALNRVRLQGGFAYCDAHAPFPERLCLENVLGAVEAGALALNYLEAVRLRAARGRVQAVVARDRLTNAEVELRGRVVVNATGPWVDQVLRRAGARGDRIGGTRGSHIVVDLGAAGPRRAIYAEAGSDGRPFFIVPWRGYHLVGTTDEPFHGDPGAVRPGECDAAYLLAEAARVLPGAPLGPEAVLYAFAGVRPLPRVEGRQAGAITRRHFLHRHDAEGLGGLISIVGGKLTGYRRVAEETVALVFRLLGRAAPPCRTATLPLVPGSSPAAEDALTRHLVSIYGGRAGLVLALARIDPTLAEPLCPHGPDIGAQVVYAARHELACTVADVLLRRTPCGWNRCRGVDAAPRVAALLAREFGWNADRTEAAVGAYREEVDATLITDAGVP